MKLFIPKDIFNNPKPPRLFLCTTGKKIINELPSYEVSLNGKWNAYAELSFSIDRQYTDVLTGETKIHPTFDKAEGLRMVLVDQVGYFVIQDPDAEYSDKDSKTLSCFSSEYSMGSKYLENFRINTGDVDSKEVLYNESIHGIDYKIDKDKFYKRSPNKFDPYESYYIKDYTDNDSYTWTQVEIKDGDHYADYDGSTVAKTLYVKNYPNVRFYYPTVPGLSLIHLVLEKTPGWNIGHVDTSLWRKERKFDEDRIAVYDFLTNDMCNTFKCVVEFDTLTNTVNFYEEAEDGVNDDGTIQTRWDTDVFISRQNLASQIQVKYSADNIKTKLKVSGADDLNIREVNLGKNYLLNLDYYHNPDWMEQDLFEAYDEYLNAVKKYSPQYTEAMQKWVAAYNKWDDLMNAVPAESDVILVGDEFKKLYCSYTSVTTAYVKEKLDEVAIPRLIHNLYIDEGCTTLLDKNVLSYGELFFVQGYLAKYSPASKTFLCTELTDDNTDTINLRLSELIKRLNLYHVDEDVNGTKTDNILLRLKNANSDVATIRIYDSKQSYGGSYNKELQYYQRKESASGTVSYTKLSIPNESVFKTYDKGSLYTNNYTIQSIVVRSDSGLSDEPSEYTLAEWIKGELTAEKMKLNDFTVQYIGTMGAYFVLAKNETIKHNLQEYGVKMLQEKHQVYTTIFQSQTEAMFSQDKYQCAAGDTEPDGEIAEGTHWLDTNSNPTTLYVYTGGKWVKPTYDLKDYENYQRYIDNYNKLKAVQEVLVEKEKEAEYLLDGFPIDRMKIDFSAYSFDSDGELRFGGKTLIGNMHWAAKIHLAGHSVTDLSLVLFTRELGQFTVNGQLPAVDIDLSTAMPLYTFKTSENSNYTYAIYLKGTTPYVSYADSQGVYQAIKDWIAKITDMENFFTEDQWIRLSPFIREDEFSDDSFLLTGFESEEERLKIYQELVDTASKELKTLSQPSLEFSMDMANILALPEFKSLFDQFQLGNFIRVGVRDDYMKRARLLEVNLNDDLSDFSCVFGNLVTTKSEIDKHAELLSQAVTAGKQVAASAGNWQKAVDKSNKLEQDISNGLQDATLEIGKANGQSVEFGQYGIRGRKLIDGTTDQYEDEQVALINNKLVFTADGWKTSKAAFGKFVVDGVEHWGVLSDAVVSGFIEGATIRGGNLRIGDGSNNYFQVSENGDVSIVQAGEEKYAAKSAVQAIDDAFRYRIVLLYDKSTIFGQPNQTCTLTCKVYELDDDITSKLPTDTTFSWLRNGVAYKTTTIPTLTVTSSDIDGNSVFACSVTFDETQIK